MEQPQRVDVWASGNGYEPYVGRWSRLVAREFLAWVAVPAGSRWLDVGCGTGALTQTILALAEPDQVTGIDRSEGFVAFAREQERDDRASFRVADAQDLPFKRASYDTAVSGLVLNFVPQPERMVKEMARVTRPDGVVAVYVWDYAGQMQLMRYFWEVAVALDPAALPLDEGISFPVCQPDELRNLFVQSGLEQIDTRAIDIATYFRDFDDYWLPFLGGQGPAPGYAMGLSEDRRTALRELIRSRLPVEPQGSIHLIARAWAVRGRPAT